MTHAKTALLADRGVVRVAGADAEKLLQGIITSDMELLAKQPALHAALLTPQGKILFEFFVARSGDGFLLETAKDQAADLARRLTMYKLRAKVDIDDASAEYSVMAVWGQAAPHSPGGTKGAVVFSDPRLPELGLRVLAEGGFARRATRQMRERLSRPPHRPRRARGRQGLRPSATPSRTRPTSTCSTACRSARAASWVRKW